MGVVVVFEKHKISTQRGKYFFFEKYFVCKYITFYTTHWFQTRQHAYYPTEQNVIYLSILIMRTYYNRTVVMVSWVLCDNLPKQSLM